MLHYFPTPYPDELWYSVLCRYHVRSGNRESATTIRNLLNDKDHGTFATFLPTKAIPEIISQLPEGLLDVRDIALNHTLFKYIFRFNSLADKEAFLASALTGGRSAFSVRIQRPDSLKELKYCPLCMKEDRETYGEAYWHTSHQIPYVSVCQKHKCRLKVRSGLKDYVLNCNLLLPDTGNMEAPDYNVSQTEMDFTNVLTKYLILPLEYGPTEGYNNLYEGLLNRGYGIVRKDEYFRINEKKLIQDLLEYFGEDMMKKHFGEEYLRPAICTQLKSWKFKTPERYALLSLFLCQEPEDTFGPRIENLLTKRFLEMSADPVKKSKKYVARELGIKDRSLDILAHNLHTAPFWEQKPDPNLPKVHKISIQFTEADWEFVSRQTKERGFQSISAFIRYCIDGEKNNYT